MHLSFDKEANINIREETASSTNGVDQRDKVKRTKLCLYPTPYTKLNSK